MDVPAAVVVVARDGTEVARWTLRPAGPPDLALLDGLARCCLAARRAGYTVTLARPTAALARLLDLVGGLGIEVGGEPEDLEQRDVEEVVVPDDPVA